LETDRSLWEASAQAWIDCQGEDGDRSRREILDPALATILGDVSGLRVADIGAGEGRYARKLVAQGAEVVAAEPVALFVEVGRKRSPGVAYVQAGGEALPLADQSFDLVLSYLSLIDIADDDRAIREMVRITKLGGRVVVVLISNVASTSDGWERDEDRRPVRRTVDNYMRVFPMMLSWKGMTIRNYHRPLSRTMSAFFVAGCVLTGFHEPLPLAVTDLYEEEVRVPTFQILEFRRES